mgnify:CR=1 FL=1
MTGVQTCALPISSPDALLRAAAVEASASLEPAQRLPLILPLLHDPTKQVRIEAARALAGPAEMQMSDADRAAFRAALAEYVDVQRYNADRAEGHMNLALLELRRGNGLLADAPLTRAIAVDPTFVPAYVQLADLYRGRREEDKAEAMLNQAVAHNPDAALAHHALGLSDRKSTRLNSSHIPLSRMPSSA